jgi:hypothetical protein
MKAKAQKEKELIKRSIIIIIDDKRIKECRSEY